MPEKSAIMDMMNGCKKGLKETSLQVILPRMLY